MKLRSAIALGSLHQLLSRNHSSLSVLLCLQVERQIDQMVKFIKQEADEKANEIAVSAEEVSRAWELLLHDISM